MTDSISIYEQYNIDLNRLSRDYLKFPLKKGNRKSKTEYPLEKDLVYLYIELNLTLSILSIVLNINSSLIGKILKKFNIIKSKELYAKSIQESKARKNPNWKKDMVKKLEQTMIKKYGRDNYFKGEEGKKAVVDACMKKYGVKSTSQLLEVKEKYKQTCMERYGAENPQQNKEINKKSHKTYFNKTGFYFPIQNTNINAKTVEKISNTLKIKSRQLNGEYWSTRNEKSYKTMKERNSFNTSKPENRIFEKLVAKFPNTTKQYKTIEYPFNCDFYIPEINLYIEYQGVFGHWLNKNYMEPFNSKNKIHRKLVKKNYKKSFEIKTYGKHKGERKLRYICAIKQYCNNDPLKRKTAKENNLNWIEFFTEEDFNKWFETI